MEDKLTSTTDFVLKIVPESEIDDTRLLDIVLNHATFLKQPLTLGMLVPCDENGNFLKQPHLGMFHDNRSPLQDLNFAKIEYEKAKEKVLFEGFESDFMEDGSLFVVNDKLQIIHEDDELNVYEIFTDKMPKLTSAKTVEDLIKYDLTLTESALKKIGLWKTDLKK